MSEQYFLRYRVSDPAAAELEIAEHRSKYDAALAVGDKKTELGCCIALGFDLIPLDREEEAVAYLEGALFLSRNLGEKASEIEAFLHLATARHYMGDSDTALKLFQQGLDKAAQYGIDDQVHYFHHHRGRLLAEMQRYDEARRDFEQALALREALGLDRQIEMSRRALAMLDGL